MPNHPCIVIPGIKGTGLENICELPPATMCYSPAPSGRGY
jgi:hypothetical protein